MNWQSLMWHFCQLAAPQLAPQHQLLLTETSGDDQEIKAPKKRAETWVQDEIKALIAYRKEMDTLFNTSKSNKHLWEQISQKMKDRGYDRSPTMCTDKWRNLLKEYKKAKIQDRGSSKIACYKDLEELLGDRAKSTPYRSPAKLDTMQLSPKGTSSLADNSSYCLSWIWMGVALRSHSIDSRFWCVWRVSLWLHTWCGACG